MTTNDTMTKKASVKTAIPGPKSKEIFDFEQQYISPGIQTIATLSELAMEKGEGCMIQDVDGNRYIDFFAGVAVASLGYNHPKYVKALQEQVAKIHVGSFATKVRADLRLAKSYTKKSEVIGFWGGFHGKTLGVVGLIGDDFKQHLGPLPFGI